MEIERPSGLRATPLGVLAVSIPVVGWSFSNVIVKIVHTPVLSFTFYRLAMGSALMAAGLALSRRRLTWEIVKASAPGGVLFGLNLILFFAALRRTSIADVLVIQALQPALILTVAGRLFGEQVSRRDVAWAGASVAGVVVFVMGSSQTPVWSLGGDLFALGSLLVWTAYFLVSKGVRRRVPAFEYMTTVTLVAAIVVAPVAVGSGQIGALRLQDWLWLALFVAAAQAGHLLLAWAHSQVDVSVSSLLLLGEPPISAVAALVILGEPITALEVAGGIVVLACVGSIVHRATAGTSVVLEEPAPA